MWKGQRHRILTKRPGEVLDWRLKSGGTRRECWEKCLLQEEPFAGPGKHIPSNGVGDGVGAGEGASASRSRGPRLPRPSWDLLRTICARSASCSRDFILWNQKRMLLSGPDAQGRVWWGWGGAHLAALHSARFSASRARRSAGDRARSGAGSSGLCMRNRS